ncbi:hypothetical protein J6590_030695 [Homalodisca vitripennis]|nr:hypothetical protein J6590_030695 [Homalodisca vitripennis]
MSRWDFEQKYCPAIMDATVIDRDACRSGAEERERQIHHQLLWPAPRPRSTGTDSQRIQHGRYDKLLDTFNWSDVYEQESRLGGKSSGGGAVAGWRHAKCRLCYFVSLIASRHGSGRSQETLMAWDPHLAR